jgi:hypothetical protein
MMSFDTIYVSASRKTFFTSHVLCRLSFMPLDLAERKLHWSHLYRELRDSPEQVEPMEWCTVTKNDTLVDDNNRMSVLGDERGVVSVCSEVEQNYKIFVR